jgi:hypothetical protein
MGGRQGAAQWGKTMTIGKMTASFAAGLILSASLACAEGSEPDFAGFAYSLDGQMPTPHEFVMNWIDTQAPLVGTMILRARQPFGPQSNLGVSFDPDGQSALNVTFRF